MANIGSFTKQPVEVLDYDIDTSDWITSGDLVITAASVSTPTGLTVVSTSIFDDGLKVKVWVSGGTSGTTYKIETTMTTSDGRTKQSEWRVKVKEV